MLFTALILLPLMSVAVQAQAEGQECYHERLGSPGTCVFMEHCVSAREELQNGLNPQLCGFRPSSMVPNVCCVKQADQQQNVAERDDPRPGSIARRKCAEHGQFVRQNEYCHIKKNSNSTVQKLVTNGVPAEPREFPHMVILGYGPRESIEYACGGSLISDRWVMTAAHCLSGPSGIVSWALLGDLDRSTEDDDARPQLVAVQQTVRHPQYLVKHNYHDIALLRLEARVAISEYVRPACLHTDTNLAVGSPVIVSGWGVTVFATDDPLSPVMLKARVNVESQAKCNDSYASAIRLPASKLPNGILNSQLCAGSKSGRDACQGDSGGPLQVFTAETPYCMQHVVGVVSFGQGCGNRIPGVYTRVAAYVEWIEQTVWQGR